MLQDSICVVPEAEMDELLVGARYDPNFHLNKSESKLNFC